MTLTVAATYEKGILVPERPLPLKEHEKVEIVIQTTLPDRNDEPLSTPPDARQTALKRLLSLQLPVADWERMEQEITQAAVE